MALSKEERSRINSENARKGAEKQRERLKDPEYRKKFSKAVSEGIKKSKKAIEARRQNMIHLNQSEEQKERASKALKKTWKEYPDFNELSHQWQKDDPDRLREVTKKALELAREKPRYVSKCEKQIKEWLHELGFKTKTNRFIIEGKNRFYDVRIDKLLIEIDGPWHFKHFYKRFNESNFDETVDKLKNQHAINNGYTLIRISNWGDKLEDQKVAIMAYINSYLLGTLDQTKIHYWGKAYEN